MHRDFVKAESTAVSNFRHLAFQVLSCKYLKKKNADGSKSEIYEIFTAPLDPLLTRSTYAIKQGIIFINL